MNRPLALLLVVIAASGVWIASSHAEPTAQPTQTAGTWQVIAAPPGGVYTMVLLNSATGETWSSNGASPSWQKMSR